MEEGSGYIGGCTKGHLKFLRSHGAGGRAGELMACAPWIKCPGEKARHLASLLACLCVCGEFGRVKGERATGGGRKQK